MSLLNGLKEHLKNPLADNNDEIDFALESDFEVALEKEIDVRLSPEDIAAILNGDDDVDDDEDDLDDESDDIDRDYVKDLESCKKALEATMTEIGLDTAADELKADEEDLELDPEEDGEVISEEALIAKCDALLEAAGMTDTNDAEDVADTGDASIPKNSGDMPEDLDKPNHDTGDASIPDNTEDPTPDGDEDEEVGKLEAECEALLAALESDEEDSMPEVDKDPDATECSDIDMKVEECGTETGAASVIANTDDATPDGDENESAGVDECDGEKCEESETPTEDENVSVKAISEEENPAIPTEGDEDEDAEPSLESILDGLMSI